MTTHGPHMFVCVRCHEAVHSTSRSDLIAAARHHLDRRCPQRLSPRARRAQMGRAL